MGGPISQWAAILAATRLNVHFSCLSTVGNLTWKSGALIHPDCNEKGLGCMWLIYYGWVKGKEL